MGDNRWSYDRKMAKRRKKAMTKQWQEDQDSEDNFGNKNNKKK